MSTFDELKAQPPSCFSNFKLKVSDSLFGGDTFIYQNVECNHCGCEKHSILGNVQVEKKGFFIKREIKSFLPPFYLQCENCSAEELLFSPDKHGWDGVNGDNVAIVGTEPVTHLGLSGNVVITYSFQGLENYEDLPIERARNMFDTFSFAILGNGQLQTIYDCECA
ncbi:hypothetical protein [Alteromonas confluentis]|uniref:Uncharacterized protein n=1 Tax=Alteromonas confluentis TaxID=1656094 RepID=A0A1E7ZH12_9ALTE|nr:hypothetical protein [Alteromonas confluentis]OFC72766.1 hypothetical protein BFC18_00110 [Alteromonas confluentis]